MGVGRVRDFRDGAEAAGGRHHRDRTEQFSISPPRDLSSVEKQNSGGELNSGEKFRAKLALLIGAWAHARDRQPALARA
jgi:hypothetical protein